MRELSNSLALIINLEDPAVKQACEQSGRVPKLDSDLLG